MEDETMISYFAFMTVGTLVSAIVMVSIGIALLTIPEINYNPGPGSLAIICILVSLPVFIAGWIWESRVVYKNKLEAIMDMRPAFYPVGILVAFVFTLLMFYPIINFLQVPQYVRYTHYDGKPAEYIIEEDESTITTVPEFVIRHGRPDLPAKEVGERVYPKEMFLIKIKVHPDKNTPFGGAAKPYSVLVRERAGENFYWVLKRYM